MSEMRQRMLRGDLYMGWDPELDAQRRATEALLKTYNASPGDDDEARAVLLRQILGSVGEGVVVKPPFRCDYGSNVTIGRGTFVNYDCIMLDSAPITIGEACQIATRVQLITATHPIDPVPRREGWEYALPIAIGDNVWLGAGVIVLPGVAIGQDTVVGAGAVVTRDLSAGIVAAGVPARVLRPIGDGDRVQP
jgi:maltose O-acetyltransferase